MAFDDYANPNVVTLGSLEFIIDGQVTTQPASSWGEGVRTGSPDFSDIDHSFHVVYEDFRGGLGSLYEKAREPSASFKDAYGLKTWHGAQIESIPTATLISYEGVTAKMDFSDFGIEQAIITADYERYAFIAAGDKVSYWQPDSGNNLRVDGSITDPPASNITYSLYTWRNNNGDEHIYWAKGNLNTTNLTKTDPDFFRRVTTIAVGTSNAWVKTTSGEQAHDFIGYNQKLLKIYFGIIKTSLDGVTWTDININVPASPDLNGGLRSKWVGLAYAPGIIRDPVPFFIRGGKLYVLHFDDQQAVEVPTGLNNIIDGTVYQDEVVVTDGTSVKLYHPDRPIRDIGLDSLQDAFVTELDGYSVEFRKLKQIGAYLIAYMAFTVAGVDTEWALWLWNGSGWHSLATPDDIGSVPVGIGVSRVVNQVPILDFIGEDILTTKRALIWCARDGTNKFWTFIIPDADALFDKHAQSIWNVGIAELVTPWFDGGFTSMPGTAIEMEVESNNLGSDVGDPDITINYQIDYSTSSWTALPVVKISPHKTVKFNSGQGVSFKAIRFKFVIRPKTDGTVPATFIAAVFKYVKTPRTRARISFNVDTAKTLDLRNGTVSKQDILDELWAFIDDNPLIPFTYTGESVRWVKIISLPRRDFLGPPGDDKYSKVTVDLIEPVGA